VRYDGFIRPPISGYYIFSADSDNGVMINLNNDTILKDRFLDMGFTDWLEELNTGIADSISNGT